MNKLVEALGKITDDHRIIEILQSLWPEGRLDLICIIQKDDKGDVKEHFRIEAWPRNSHKGKALGKQYPYMYGKEARPDADNTLDAWKHVVADLPQCKWKCKPSASLARKVQHLIQDLDQATYNTSEAIALNMPKGSTVIIRYRTPSKTNYADRFRKVHISLTPVKYKDSRMGDQAVGNGESVSSAALKLRREFKRINANTEYAQKEALQTAHRRNAEGVLAGAEPGDFIVQSEGYPTLILVEKMDGWAVKAQPVGKGNVIRYGFLSVHKTPQIIHNGPLTRKLLLAYARGREKLQEHVKVHVRQPCNMLAVRVGSKEFGIYLRRDFREVMSPFIMFTGP